MKKQKCSRCKKLIPEEQVAYIKGKVVCQYCYGKLKIGRGERRATLVEVYRDWLARE